MAVHRDLTSETKLDEAREEIAAVVLTDTSLDPATREGLNGYIARIERALDANLPYDYDSPAMRHLQRIIRSAIRDRSI